MRLGAGQINMFIIINITIFIIKISRAFLLLIVLLKIRLFIDNPVKNPYWHGSILCVSGGLAAVIYTDAVQTVVMTIGAVALAIISK